MGQRADTLEREIVADRERMSHTIDQLERQFRKTMDWKTRIMANPLPYAAGAVVVIYLLVGGPRRTAALIRSTRPRPKTRLEKLLEQLPEPLADRILPPTKAKIDDLQELSDDMRKRVRQAEKERDKQLQKEEEQRLKRAARATMIERVLMKTAEAAGAAAAAAALKLLSERLFKEEEPPPAEKK